MFRIHMLAADHGDCLWLEYGDPTKPHRVLIDGGTSSTWPRLKRKIEAEKELRGADTLRFEALIITHVDADHIGGAIKLLEQVGPLGLEFGDVWFNGYHHLSDYAGAKMGEQLSTLIEAWQLNWNRAFAGDRVVVSDTGALPTKAFADLKLTLLSPTAEKLRKLLPKWRDEVRRAGLVPGDAYQAVDYLGRDDAEPAAPDHAGLGVRELAETAFVDDKTEANGSSIAFLAEYGGKSVLFGADAHASVLIESLQRLSQRPEYLDAFKTSHHGSRNNTSKELIELAPARAYLVSTNGNQFKHPHAEAIARIAVHAPHKKELVFNCPSAFNQRWSHNSIAEKWLYRASYGSAEGGATVEL